MNTVHCPVMVRCESCGSLGGIGRDALRVCVFTALNGEFCVTMCPTCANSGQPPSIQLSTAVRLAEQHANHLRSRA